MPIVDVTCALRIKEYYPSVDCELWGYAFSWNRPGHIVLYMYKQSIRRPPFSRLCNKNSFSSEHASELYVRLLRPLSNDAVLWKYSDDDGVFFNSFNSSICKFTIIPLNLCPSILWTVPFDVHAIWRRIQPRNIRIAQVPHTMALAMNIITGL